MKHDNDLSSPFTGGQDVTPSDTDILTKVSRSLFVGTEGNLAAVTQEGQTLTFVAIAGWVPGRFTKVLATGTTATDIVAVW